MVGLPHPLKCTFISSLSLLQKLASSAHSHSPISNPPHNSTPKLTNLSSADTQRVKIMTTWPSTTNRKNRSSCRSRERGKESGSRSWVATANKRYDLHIRLMPRPTRVETKRVVIAVYLTVVVDLGHHCLSLSLPLLTTSLFLWVSSVERDQNPRSRHYV